MKYFCFLLVLIVKASCNTGDVINTPFGNVDGIDLSFDDGIVTEYLGLPYAHPPMDSYRLKPPVELDDGAYQNTQDASQEDSYHAVTSAEACPQIIRTMNFPPYDDVYPKVGNNEDCLKFNMWVPKDQTNMPVMVFLHGGSFTVKTASVDKLNGSVLALTTKSIVITPNFRLGFFGFGYLKDSAVTGNMGLLDQLVLLKWINKAIESFGGDKSRVTLFGSGTGSCSIAAHLFSDESKDYFKRGIMSAGSITHFMSTVSTNIADTNTKNVSRIVGCINDENTTPQTNDDILQCLQGKTVDELLQAARSVRAQDQAPTPFPFMPVNDDTVFFKGNIKEKAISKTFNKEVDLMMGRTADEATFFMATGFTNNTMFGCQFFPHLSITDPANQCEMTEQNFINLINYGGQILKFNETEIEKLKTIYESSASTYTNRSIRLISDFMVDCAHSEFGIEYSKDSEKSVFFYEYTRRSPINKWPTWTGAMHGDDLNAIFGIPFRHPEKYSEEILEKEQTYSRNLMWAIGNFTANGTPFSLWQKGSGDDPDAVNLDGELKLDTSPKTIKFRPPTCDEFDNLFKESMQWKMQQSSSTI